MLDEILVNVTSCCVNKHRESDYKPADAFYFSRNMFTCCIVMCLLWSLFVLMVSYISVMESICVDGESCFCYGVYLC